MWSIKLIFDSFFLQFPIEGIEKYDKLGSKTKHIKFKGKLFRCSTFVRTLMMTVCYHIQVQTDMKLVWKFYCCDWIGKNFYFVDENYDKNKKKHKYYNSCKLRSFGKASYVLQCAKSQNLRDYKILLSQGLYLPFACQFSATLLSIFIVVFGFCTLSET